MNTYVGVGTTSPANRLDVSYYSSVDEAAVRGDGAFGPTRGYLGAQGATDFDGITTLDISGNEIGVLGVSVGGSSTDNYGVYGFSNYYGGHFQHESSGNYADIAGDTYGVYNYFNSPTSGTSYGMYNYVNPNSSSSSSTYGIRNYMGSGGSSGTRYGIYNYISNTSSHTSTVYGIYNSMSSSGTGTHYGVYSYTYGSGNRAIYGSNSHSSGWAGYFSGRGYFSSNTGIGTTAPARLLHVARSSPAWMRIQTTTNAFTAYVGIELLKTGSGNTDWAIRSAQSPMAGNFVVSRSTNDFGSMTDHYRLYNTFLAPVVDNQISLGLSGNRFTSLWATDGTINTSDGREKEDIEPIHYGIADVMKLKPVSFKWKNRSENGKKLGLIAQDVREVLNEVVVQGNPEGIQTNDEGIDENTDRLGIYYSDIIPVLIKGMQEQQQTIEDLQQQVEVLQQMVEENNSNNDRRRRRQ